MLGKEMLMTMFDYNAAMNARLLDFAANVSDEQLDAPTDFSHGTLRKTLAHYLAVEWMWRHVFAHGTAPTAPPAIGPASTVAEFQAFAAEEARQIRASVERLTDDGLAATVTVERRGVQSQMVRWHMLMQTLYHSAQHRGEVAAMLTNYDQSPGDIDFIFFVRPVVG